MGLVSTMPLLVRRTMSFSVLEISSRSMCDNVRVKYFTFDTWSAIRSRPGSWTQLKEAAELSRYLGCPQRGVRYDGHILQKL